MFEGFSPEASDFYWQLLFHNERPWFQEHHDEYVRLLKTPLDELAKATTPYVERLFPDQSVDCHVSRIFRDARRLYGRGPYKDHVWIAWQDGVRTRYGPCFWFEIGPAKYGYGMGYYCLTAAMEEFRRSIDKNPAPMEKLARKFDRQSTFILEGELYKKPKKDVGGLLNPWYNRKYIGLTFEADFGGELLSPELPRILGERFSFLLPYYNYFRSLPQEGGVIRKGGEA